MKLKSKKLKRLWSKNDRSKLPADQVKTIVAILDMLHAMQTPEDLANFPALRFHQLKGSRADTFAATVTASWRITF